MNKIAILVCALLLAAGTNPVLAAPHLPDPSTGSIGNEQAILVWPIDSGTGALQDAHDCVVHVVNEAGEQTYACGSWFKPSRGQHSVWLETADQISNERVSMTYGGGKFPGIGKQLLLPTVAAGFVRIDTSNVSQTVDTLRVLSLAATGFPFERRVSPGAQATRVKAPSGQIVVGAFNSRNEAIAISQPIQLKPGGTSTVVLREQAAASLLAVIDRPPRKPEAGRNESKLLLEITGRTLPPDVFVDGAGRLFGIWYDLPAGNGTLTLESESLVLNPAPTMALQSRRMATIRTCAEMQEESQPQEDNR